MSKAYLFNDIAYNITTKKVPTEADMATYIGLEHLESGSLYVKEFGSKVPIKGEKLAMTKGDILLGKRNAYLRRAAIAPHDGLFSAHGMLLRPKTDVIDERFFPFFIASDYFFDEAIRISVGGLSPTINWKDLKNVEFELPTIEEQRVLADKLWAAYELKEAYKKMIAATDEMVKSQFIEMFGGIQNNTKWPLKSIGEICEMVNGYTFKSTKYSNQGYSIIRIANVQKGIIEDEDKVYYPEEYKSEFAESILKEGDILMSLTGNVGRVGVIYEQHLPAALNQRVQGLRIKDSSQINHQYLFSLLNLDDFETLCIKNASGSAQLNLSTVWLRNCKIVCPPIQEQEHFAKIAKQADKSKFELQQAIDKIDKVMKSLLQ